MMSSYLKTSVFARPHEYDKKKSPPWRAYLKTFVFGALKRRLRVDGSVFGEKQVGRTGSQIQGRAAGYQRAESVGLEADH